MEHNSEGLRACKGRTLGWQGDLHWEQGIYTRVSEHFSINFWGVIIEIITPLQSAHTVQVSLDLEEVTDRDPVELCVSVSYADQDGGCALPGKKKRRIKKHTRMKLGYREYRALHSLTCAMMESSPLVVDASISLGMSMPNSEKSR